MSLSRFIRRGYDDFDRTANFLPSSRWLVGAMAKAATLQSSRVVVELGPGTGAVTSGLLDAMPGNGTLCTIECDAAMNEVLTDRVRDRRLDAVLGDAQELEAILNERGYLGKIDTIVSSLGTSLLPGDVRDRIYDAIGQVLPRDGLLVQYAYAHATYAVYSPTRGWSRFDAGSYLRARFERVERSLVSLNFPPAWVYRCSRPKPRASA